MNLDEAVTELLPYAKKTLLAEQDKIQSYIYQWISTKGFMIRWIGTKFIPISWDLITGPMLPHILKISISIACGLSAPYMTPFIPLINVALDYLNNKYLDEAEKKKILEIINLITCKDSILPSVGSAISMETSEKQQLVVGQEYFQ